MYQWPSAKERIQGIQKILGLFCKERQEFREFKEWEIKLKSEKPIVFELTLDNLTKEITDEEISTTEDHILWTQFIVSKTKEELLLRAFERILSQKFGLE